MGDKYTYHAVVVRQAITNDLRTSNCIGIIGPIDMEPFDIAKHSMLDEPADLVALVHVHKGFVGTSIPTDPVDGLLQHSKAILSDVDIINRQLS